MKTMVTDNYFAFIKKEDYNNFVSFLMQDTDSTKNLSSFYPLTLGEYVRLLAVGNMNYFEAFADRYELRIVQADRTINFGRCYKNLVRCFAQS